MQVRYEMSDRERQEMLAQIQWGVRQLSGGILLHHNSVDYHALTAQQVEQIMEVFRALRQVLTS